MWSFDVFFIVNLNKLLNKRSNCHWFETTWMLSKQLRVYTHVDTRLKTGTFNFFHFSVCSAAKSNHFLPFCLVCWHSGPESAQTQGGVSLDLVISWNEFSCRCKFMHGCCMHWCIWSKICSINYMKESRSMVSIHHLISTTKMSNVHQWKSDTTKPHLESSSNVVKPIPRVCTETEWSAVELKHQYFLYKIVLIHWLVKYGSWTGNVSNTLAHNALQVI